MANPLKILTALSASSGVAVSGSDGLKVQQGGLTVLAGTSTFAGTTISDLGAVTTVDINGGTIDNASIGTTTQSSGQFTTISGSSTLQVGGTTTLVGDVTFGGNIVSEGDENKSIFAAVTSQTITVGAAGATVSIPGTASVGGNLTVTGNLTVNGTTVTVNAEEVVVEDKNIILGAVASPTDSTADGGGITLSGSTNKTFQWANSTDSWTSSENLDLASGKTFKIGAVDALKVVQGSTTLTAVGATIDFTGSALVSGSSESLVGVVNSPIAGEFAIVSGSAGLVLEGGNTFGMELRSPQILLNGPVEIITGSGGTFTSLPAGNTAGSIDLTGSLDYILTNLSNGDKVTSAQYYNARVAGTASKANEADITITLKNASGVFNDDGGNGYRFPAVNGLSSSTAGDSGFQELMDRLSYASFDVAVKASGSLTSWTNDLVSVTVSGSFEGDNIWYPKFTISAPGLTPDASAKIRLVVVNEVSGALAL